MVGMRIVFDNIKFLRFAVMPIYFYLVWHSEAAGHIPSLPEYQSDGIQSCRTSNYGQ